MSRIPMIFLIGILFYANFTLSKTLAFVLYVVAGITDWLDGYIARKYHQISVSIFIILAGKNLIPNWGIFCILIIICREFFITGLRTLIAKSGVVMAAEKLGKIKTVLQIVVLGSFFLIEMLKIDAKSWCPEGFTNFLTYINYTNFLLMTGLTAYSGYNYLKKYHKYL